jgi:hypothetical protein
MFYGIEYNIDVRDRFRELEGEINAVSEWFNAKNKQSSSLNARMSIVTEIMRIFEEYGQFDEQQDCMCYLRKLNRKWYFSRHQQMRFFQPFRWYIETLVGSFPCFIVALISWPALGGIISFANHADFGQKTTIVVQKVNKVIDQDFAWHLINAISTFFGIQPVSFPVDFAARIITVMLILTGFLHLGIFISHLYTLITRGK